jgi:hypothetical protein
MPKEALTQQDIDHLGWLLNEQGDRTAFHLHYYELTGNKEALAAAKISHLTDFEGAVAERGNEVVQQLYPDQYPQGGVFDFSRDVASTIYNAVTKDFNEGTGTGVLTERGYLEAAREAWDAKGLGDQFLGNPLLAGERALEGDLRGAWDAFNSQGTDLAVEAAAYTVTPDISGNPHPGLQERLENATYHLTEDGKAGFYTDRETGHIIAVFDRPTDLTTEPPIQSQGILNTFVAPEQPTPDPMPSPTSWKDESIPFHEQPAHSYLFDSRPENPWAEAMPFAAGVALGAAIAPEPSPPQAVEAVPSYELQLPNGLLNTDFGTGGSTQPSYDDRSAIPDAFQAPQAAIGPTAEPAPEPQTGGLFSGIQDYVNSFSFTPSRDEVANVLSMQSPVTHDPAPVSEPAPKHEPHQPSVLEQVSSFFSSPLPAPEPAPVAYESAAPAPESHHESGFSVGSLFGGGNSTAPEPSPPPPSQSSYSNESSYGGDSGSSHGGDSGSHGGDSGSAVGGGDSGGSGGGGGGD